MNSHTIKTWMPFYQDIVDGKKPFEFRFNDRNYQVGDEVIFIEFSQEEEKETGRRILAQINYVLQGGQFGVPENYVVFGFHTSQQQNYIRDFDTLSNKILPEYEKLLSHKRGGGIIDRISHLLTQLNETANNSIFKSKHFIDDVKVQFKALEIVLEGVTDHSKNHSEKRVIANHVIKMLRDMIDRIDKFEWEYGTGMHDHYNFFRSNSPEGNLVRRYKEMKNLYENLQRQYQELHGKVPDELKSPDLPF